MKPLGPTGFDDERETPLKHTPNGTLIYGIDDRYSGSCLRDKWLQLDFEIVRIYL